MAAVGAGILWLGWNGFNGGDPYYAGADAAAAVVNTNLATAAGVIAWMAMDAWLSKEKKPTFLGGVNGMICGLVGDHPLCRLGQRLGRHLRRVDLHASIVWFAWNYLSKVRPFSQGRRRARGRLHPRHRRVLRRPAARGLRRPEHARVRLRSPGRQPGRWSIPRPTTYVTRRRRRACRSR